ncbi:hypothetical protein DFH06DRAFT_1148406 [Mycena polygramma]|nr:hypothetical protein DFH06DRAFT_1148406 [Mycena polygramma]
MFATNSNSIQSLIALCVDGALTVFALPAGPGRGWFEGGGGEAVTVAVSVGYKVHDRSVPAADGPDSIVHVPLSPALHPSVAPILALRYRLSLLICVPPHHPPYMAPRHPLDVSAPTRGCHSRRNRLWNASAEDGSCTGA